MANRLTKDALLENMKVKLQAFNNEKVEITNDTIHKEVLAGDDGFESAPPSKKLYYGGIQWVIWDAGGVKVKWPNNWMDFSVNDLSDFIMEKQTA